MNMRKSEMICVCVGFMISGLCWAGPVQKLAGGFQFTEGPAADAEGNVYFTDIPNSRIHCWSVEGKLTTFKEDTNRANGLYFDADGKLIACAGGAGQLVSIDKNGTVKVLAGEYQGKPFNSPNDLWIDPKGGIYFTDPRYGRRDNLPQGGEHVYYLLPDRKTVIRVINDMVRPNGVLGTPDGKRLYVADPGANQTFVYTIEPDGTLSGKTLFVDHGSDGMTLDAAGNLYMTTEAVKVYSPAGELINTIAVPENPANVCFGGPDRKTLFITARTSLYGVDMMNIASKFYTFTMDDIDGEPVALSQYRGKVLLVVNVASKCGRTKQYAGLQELYDKYKDRGLVVLGFPANNFGKQDPGTNAEIKVFCSATYNVTFPMFAKISVKGDDMHPLYQYLTSPEENGENGKAIEWNFAKFLIGRDGATVGRFHSKVDPMTPEVIEAVEAALGQ
ncbi:MAG: SMP-30/gluconolactonase/LRE family protein [Planctomycetota bacterium]